MTRHLAGELPSGQAGRLARHLERCEGCRREQVAYAALDRALGQLPLAAAMPRGLEQDTLRRVRLEAAGSASVPARSVRWVGITVPVLAAAAAVVLVLRAPQDTPQPVRVVTAPLAKALPAPPQPAPPPAAPRAAAPASPAPPPASRKRRTPPVEPPEPPPELAARPDLFINLPLLRNMERLEHYDAITAVGDQGTPSNG